MKQLLKRAVQNTPLRRYVNILTNTLVFRFFAQMKTRSRNDQEIVEWENKGRPAPPPHAIKLRALDEYAKTFGLRVLVETGTFYGDTVAAMTPNFDRIYSIELSSKLHERAKARFRGVRNVELILGDSGVELANVVKRLNQPALFWLDGHYSAGDTARGNTDTPIYEELAHILDAPERGHVCIVDDARCFGSDPGYPSIENLTHYIKLKRPDVSILVQHDSIRIAPRLLP